MSTPNTHFGAEAIGRMLEGCKSVYFIGIGGVNMSSLARITRLRGFRVGGSDRAPGEITRELEKNGITVFYSHDARNMADYDAVVYTIAIAPDNPEYVAAAERGIPCISRADYLGYIMTGYRRRVGISGMHGKSTTTSMCGLAFREAGGDPTVLCGASMPEFGGYYHIGGTDNFVFEACEYMDSFLDFNPTAAVVLNIEMDHVDYFHDLEQIRRSYAAFAGLTGPGGIAVVNLDDENVRLAMKDYGGTLVTFSAAGDPSADYYAAGTDNSRGTPSFDIRSGKDGSLVAHADLSVPGIHNVSNALAAVAAAAVCGLDPVGAARGVSAFRGAARRMEFKGRLNGAMVFDDYGHHPTEIAATLRGCRAMGFGRVFCVFQPHTYSRTAGLLDRFVTSLSLADRVLLADIYAARETDTLGVSSPLLASLIGPRADAFPDFASIAAALKKEVCEGDALIVMGAGDIYRVFPLLELQ